LKLKLHAAQATSFSIAEFCINCIPSYQTALNHISMITSARKPYFLRRLKVTTQEIKTSSTRTESTP